MERLTYFKDGYWRVNFSGVQYQADFVDRLAAYEDTDLTPEEIKAPLTEDAMINLAAQALGVEADRLRDLAEADKEGRVVDCFQCVEDCPCKKCKKGSAWRWKGFGG